LDDHGDRKQITHEAICNVNQSYLYLFTLVTQDNWFKRAWTYHERHVGGDIYSSFHIAPRLSNCHGLGIIARIKTAFAQVLSMFQSRSEIRSNRNLKDVHERFEGIMRANFDFARKELDRVTIDEHWINQQDFNILETSDVTFASDRLQVLANVRK
jgi:hypothetical protein